MEGKKELGNERKMEGAEQRNIRRIL